MFARALRAGCLFAALASGQTSTAWRSGDGSWNDATHWSAAVPTAAANATVGGASRIAIPSGDWLVGGLRIGTRTGDRARVDLNGGSLILMRDSLVVGEATDGSGEFYLNSGALQSVMDVFVGAATASTGRANDSILRIRGGSFLGRTLSVGFGYGSHSTVAIAGSQASAVQVLDYVYLRSAPDPAGRAGLATLEFTLDQHGVTPVAIESRTDGLRIAPSDGGECRLKISVSAVPPRENITLVSAHVRPRGIFTGLPEGAEISATYSGQTYRWALTYHGGTSGADLVLLNRSSYTADAPVTHVRAFPAPPRPLWRDRPLYPLTIPAGTPAFAGAEGYGAYARGGQGGVTIYVDNLDDAGPGSLRAALQAEGPRTVAFRTSGFIRLKSPIVVRNPFLTLDAQGAPGEGITLSNHGLAIRTHDVILRYFRIRIGDAEVTNSPNYEAGEGEDALRFEDGASNCIADHLSLSWSTGKIVTLTLLADLITVQWCILSESLNFAGHGYAALSGGGRVTWHHNLFAHNFSRNIRFQGGIDADFRNNTVYDWGSASAYGEFDRVNYAGNYLKAGPSTTQVPRGFHDGAAVVLPGSIYLAGNILDGSAGATEDNWRGMGSYFRDRDSLQAAQPFPAPSIAMQPAAEAYARVLAEAGDALPARDSVDLRIAGEVRDGSGHIIRWVREAGK